MKSTQITPLAALVGCLLFSTVVACAATDRAKNESEASAEPSSSTLSTDKQFIPKGWGMGSKCLTDDDWTLPNKNNQKITIVVAPGKKGGTKFQVLAFPICAGISRKGELKFVLNTDLLEADAWDPTYTVKIEFDVEGATTPHNGPFERVNGKPKERGIYTDVFGKDVDGNDNDVIPGTAIDNRDKKKIPKGWKGAYTVTIRDLDTKVLGALDPGVKVIDGP